MQKDDTIFGVWYCLTKRILCIGGPKKFAVQMQEFASHFQATLTAEITHGDKQRFKLLYSCTGFAFLSGKRIAENSFFIFPVDRFKRIMN